MTDYLKQHPNDANARAIVEGIAKVLTDDVRIRSSLDEVPQVGRVQADDAPGFFSTNDGGYSICWVMTVSDVLEGGVGLDLLPWEVRASAERSARTSMEFAVGDFIDEYEEELEGLGLNPEELRRLAELDPYQAEGRLIDVKVADGDGETVDVSGYLSQKINDSDADSLMQFEVRLVHRKDDPEGEVHVAVMANDDGPYFRDNGDFFRQTGVRHINPAATGPEMMLFQHDVMRLDDLTEEVAEEVVDRFRTALLHPSLAYEEAKAATHVPAP